MRTRACPLENQAPLRSPAADVGARPPRWSLTEVARTNEPPPAESLMYRFIWCLATFLPLSCGGNVIVDQTPESGDAASAGTGAGGTSPGTTTAASGGT